MGPGSLRARDVMTTGVVTVPPDTPAPALARLLADRGISSAPVTDAEGRMLAMVQSPDNKTYIVRASDRLLDGEVRTVTAEAVVFVQNVNDPLSPVRQREIRKPLRIVEEGK